jgi:L-alanine-DL-glutamate epimerase-like enolase superfamily enzyme
VLIRKIDVFGHDLTYVGGDYVMSSGRVVSKLPSTLVRLTTDEGLEGWGETCALGSTYLPAFGQGARAALRELAPHVLGLDPCNLASVYAAMDGALGGHGYAKSPIDVACWDLLGKATGKSISTLLGGRRQERYPLYVAVPFGPAEQMVDQVATLRAEGICHFQLKVGSDPAADAERVHRVVEATNDNDRVIADANCGWRLQDAVIAARLLDSLPRTYLEQPCRTLEECLYVRARTTLPIVLDEIVTDVPALLRAFRAGAMDAINLKIGRVGGLTPAKLVRDLAQSLGLRLTIEDTWGGDVTTAAISHLAASTDPGALFTVSFMNSWVNEHIAGFEPRSGGGVGETPSGPGLGIEVDVELLEEPLFSVE